MIIDNEIYVWDSILIHSVSNVFDAVSNEFDEVEPGKFYKYREHGEGNAVNKRILTLKNSLAPHILHFPGPAGQGTQASN